MAANNYFGFAHGGTQYSAQPAGTYAAPQTAYVQPAHQAAAFATAAPRAAQTYDAYQTAHTPGTYAYATRTAQLSNKIMVVMAPPPPPATTQTFAEPYYTRTTQPTAYDATKTYYQPAQATYTVAAEVPQYHAAKPVYTASTSYNTSAHARAAATQKTPTVVAAAATTTPSSYVYQGAATTTVAAAAPATTSYSATTAASSSTYSGRYGNSSIYGVTTGLEKSGKKLQKIPAVGYDAALYSAATTYYQQQQAAKSGSSWTYKKGVQQKKVPNKAPKGPQLHYCDVCKISCAGPQTYREHLEGQKHKKKEASMKTGTTSSSSGRSGQNQLRCELCDVSCTGSDAYAAHIRGAKHQKVLKLHTKLGKPIPSTDPVVVTTASASTTTKSAASTSGGGKPAAPTAAPTAKKVLATPKITFVGGTQLKTTGVKAEEVKAAAPVAAAKDVPAETLDDDDDKPFPGEKDVQPVGHEYIEEVKNEIGKIISFNCKLCECKFNDPNAKEMHMKGRRHRLQYKKKVDPSLVVEVKPSIRARKLQEEKLKRQAQREEYWRRRDQEERWREEMSSRMEEEMYWEERRRYEEEMEYMEWQRRTGGRGMPPRPFPPQPPMGMPMRRPDTSDDRHVMSKHASIYPNEAELQAVQNIVSSCEKALKLVSDFIAESEGALTTDTKEEVKEEPKSPEKEGSEKKDDSAFAGRALKGVMRVGVLAKGLLLHGDLNVHLVVLCAEKPTRTLLERVADCLPKQLTTVTEDEYEVKMCVEEAAVIVSSIKEPLTTCTVTVTSPIIRDENTTDGESVSVKDPPDVLDRQKCLGALAALRHAKWFQARANGLQSCVVVIRILRDLCQRVPTWAPLNQWGMELLVEKCVSSGGPHMNPGDALRRVFECIASGILLPGGPGLYDPCEKEPTDAAATLSSQEREDITASAQHALRLIAFRQIHKVLGMDPLPAPRFNRQRFNPRKRRRTNSAGEGADDSGEKKDKKDADGDTAMEPAATATTASAAAEKK